MCLQLIDLIVIIILLLNTFKTRLQSARRRIAGALTFNITC